MMIKTAGLAFIFLLSQVESFTTVNTRHSSFCTHKFRDNAKHSPINQNAMQTIPSKSILIPCHHRHGCEVEATESSSPSDVPNMKIAGVAAMNAIILGGGAVLASAAEDVMDVEVAELPPPYVPIVFAVALIAGVGLLTGSLGDVIAEGML